MEERVDTQFRALSYDLIQNNAESNAILGLLVSGRIKVLELFVCDPELLSKVRDEAAAIATQDLTHGLASGHPTFDYIRKWDPKWAPKPNTIFQYSVYNSRDDLSFFDEDHHWFEGRRFNTRLKYIPEFFRAYFRDTELQNFRIQAVMGGGDLGLHRERIVAIPKREHDYKLRFHLPVLTNPHVSFIMDDEQHVMEEGRVYLFNQSCLHGVSNTGNEIRVHLVWDCYLNDHIVKEFIIPGLKRHDG